MMWRGWFKKLVDMGSLAQGTVLNYKIDSGP